MPERTKLDVGVTEEDLTAALMRSRDPADAWARQVAVDAYLKYGKAFLQAWIDMSDRFLQGAATRIKVADASPSLEEQGQLIGRHSVEGMLQAGEEYARFAHHCAVLWASMMNTALHAQDARMAAAMPAAEPAADTARDAAATPRSRRRAGRGRGEAGRQPPPEGPS